MQFDLLYQELAQGIETVRRLAGGLTQVEARFKPDPATWSVLEVVCHLYDEEREDFRPRLDVILHRPQEPWSPIDPAGWVTARRYNERNLAEMLDNLAAERHRSLTWLRNLSAPNWEAEYKAPFGPLKAGDMFAAWVAHDTLHLRQLVELRRARVLKLVGPYDVGYAGEW